MNRQILSLLALGLGSMLASTEPLTASPQGQPPLTASQHIAAEFFIPVPANAVTRVTSMTAAKRQRNVRLNLNLMQNDGANAANKFSFRLFDDTVVTGSILDIEMAYADGYVVELSVDQDPNGHIYLSVVDQALTATFRFNGSLYQVHCVGNGQHTISEVDEGRMQGCGTPHAKPGVGQPVGGDAPTSQVVDMLVVYTDDARSSNGGTSGINSLINLAIFETNRSYAKSDINMRVNLVHTAEVAFNEGSGSMSNWVGKLRSTTDGVIDQVHTMRDEYGADAVSMIVDTGGYCGIAYWVMTGTSGAASKAFNVTKDTCATGYYSFGHELGHCLGAQHDPSNTSGAALYPYCYGYRTVGNAYRTVMAYAPGTRLDIWSNPAKVAPNGLVLGVANSQDNHRVLNNVAATASGWRAHRDAGHRITTRFDSNNGFAGNMFNIQPKDDITITHMYVNTNTAVNGAVDVRVWFRANSYVGNENSAAGWCVLGQYVGKSAGIDKGTRINLPNNKTFRSGRTYGIFVELLSYSGAKNLRYTNGTPQSYENNHLKLITGVGKGSGGFSGSTFANRKWNGRIYYRGGDGGRSLSTTFASNNGASGNMFTVKPKVSLTINSFDVNLSGTGYATVDVWYRSGSYVGFEQNANGWTFAGSDFKATTAGQDKATRITVGDIPLTAGKTYSFYIYAGSTQTMRYTNGSGTYSNSHLTITTGVGRGLGAFSGAIFTPRSWNGRIRYSISPFASIGKGCRGSKGAAMKHTASGSAEVGLSTTYAVTSAVPGSSAFLVFGVSNKKWSSFILPLDLGFLGAPGCMVYQDMPVTFGSFRVPSTGKVSVKVRFNECSLIGLTLYSQYIAIDRFANRLGITTSNGMSTLVGQ